MTYQGLTGSDHWGIVLAKARPVAKPQHATGVPRLAALHSGIDPERVREHRYSPMDGWTIGILGATPQELARYEHSVRCASMSLVGQGLASAPVCVRSVEASR